MRKLQSAARAARALSEEAANYSGVLWAGATLRVVASWDRRQYVLQAPDPDGRRPRWIAVARFYSRDAMLRLAPEIRSDPALVAWLRDQPPTLRARRLEPSPELKRRARRLTIADRLPGHS